ncbi:hypothetical protein STEG23_021337 [Scotinomys teguina]
MVEEALGPQVLGPHEASGKVDLQLACGIRRTLFPCGFIASGSYSLSSSSSTMTPEPWEVGMERKMQVKFSAQCLADVTNSSLSSPFTRGTRPLPRKRVYLVHFPTICNENEHIGAVFGEEGPCGIVVCNLDTCSVSLVYLALLHPGCQHPPSLLLAQECWNTVVDAHTVSSSTKVGTFACDGAGVVGLQERFLTPRSFPHSHCSGNSAGNCVEDPYDVDSVYNGYSLLRIYCLELELHQGL